MENYKEIVERIVSEMLKKEDVEKIYELNKDELLEKIRNELDLNIFYDPDSFYVFHVLEYVFLSQDKQDAIITALSVIGAEKVYFYEMNNDLTVLVNILFNEYVYDEVYVNYEYLIIYQIKNNEIDLIRKTDFIDWIASTVKKISEDNSLEEIAETLEIQLNNRLF